MPKVFSEKEKEEFKKQLIQEYKIALAEENTDNIISVEKLTKKVGIAKGSFYNLYAYKELLFVDVVNEVTNEIKADICAILHKAKGSSKEKLKEILCSISEYIEKYPWLNKISSVEYEKIINKLPENIKLSLLEEDRRLYLYILNSLNANFKISLEDAIGMIQMVLFTVPYSTMFNCNYNKCYMLLIDSLIDKIID